MDNLPTRRYLLYWSFLLIGVSLLFLLGAVLVAAQEGTAVSRADCQPALEALWTAASDACIGGPAGYVCNGGSPPLAEPAGPVSNALAAVGAVVEVGVIDAIHTPGIAPDGSSGGSLWVRLAPPIQMIGLLVGDVRLRDVAPAGFPPWQSMMVVTGAEVPACSAAPRNAFIVQSPLEQPARVVINGVSLMLNGTVLVQTVESQTLFISLSGQSQVNALGHEQPVWMGQQVSVPYNPGDFSAPTGSATAAQPLDLNLTQQLPTPLLDRPVLLPQPGYAETQDTVNLRAAPSDEGTFLGEISAGEVLSVLGRDPSGAWFHVRLDSGETGWMLAELLLTTNLGNVQTVYMATPVPPQRYGELGRVGRVQAPAGANLRAAPDVGFASVAIIPDGTPLVLLARSPYSPWVKVDANGVVGWLALIAVDTDAYIGALPIDYEVPPPPPPTPVPGSFGNAFPNPRDGGDGD